MIALQTLHWGLALIPVLLLLGLFVWFDAFKLMNLREILILLALGGLAAVATYPVSGRLIDTLPIGFSNYSRFVAPWIEEAVKGLVVVGLFRLNKIGFKLDAVISGFAIGAGFSVIENIIYLIRLPEYGAGTWLVRGLGTAVMHGTTLALMAASAHEFSERETREAAGDFDFNLLWFVPGFLVAVAIHTLFNQFGGQPLVAMLGAAMFAPLAILAIFNFGTSEAQAWLETEHKQHEAELAELEAGRWPATTGAHKVIELADRSSEAVRNDIRRYWRVLAGLVVEAEQSLLEEASGDVEIDAAAVRAAFDDLAQIERRLGPTTFTTLRRLLPFSRNDLWELSELRQRVDASSRKR